MTEKRNNINALGRVLYIIARIVRVCICIGLFFIAVAAITVPALFGKIDINKHYIDINSIPDTKVRIFKDSKQQLTMRVNNKDTLLAKELTKEEYDAATEIYDKVQNTTKGAVLAYVEASLIFSIVSLVLVIIAIKNLEKFCLSLRNNDEVFTEDKPTYLKKAAKLFIITYIISVLSTAALSGIYDGNYSFNFNSIGLVEILVLFLVAYIFEYAIGLDSKPIEATIAKPKKTTKKKKEEK